ncbi:MAG: hypothetical protein WCE87_14050 [Candidatus Udaeobacter sp.]
MQIVGLSFVSTEPSLLAYFNSSLKVAAIVGITIVFAAGSYMHVEVPAQRWIRKKLT